MTSILHRHFNVVYSSLVLSLFGVFCLPEAFDQRSSIGVLWIGATAISPADLMVFAILIIATIVTAASGRLAYPSTATPLLLLAVVAGGQALRGFVMFEPREVIKDIRPIFGWLCILGIAQFLRTPERKRLWARHGMLLLLVPPAIVVVAMVGMVGFGGLQSTFGPVGRISFANDWPVVLGMLTTGNLWLRENRQRHYWLFFGTTAIVLVSWLFSQSRASFVVIVAAVALLAYSAFRQRRLVRLFSCAFLPAGVLLCLAAIVAPAGKVDAFERLRLHLSNKYELHDYGRFAMMRAVAKDFLAHPLTGAGLGKVYFRPTEIGGGTMGEKLSSPSDSLLVDLAGKTGILGVGSFLWLLAAFFVQLKRVRRRMDSQAPGVDKAFVDASLAALPIVLFMSAVGNAWWMYRIPPLQMAVWFTTIHALEQTLAPRLKPSGLNGVAQGSRESQPTSLQGSVSGADCRLGGPVA